MRRVLVVSAALACLMTAQAHAATVACFAPADAKEAHLRQMQQEFTVAALSCGTAQPQHETIADRYNAFIGKFAIALRDNAHALLAHFSQHGGASGFDNWMTKLANAASVEAATDPDYCQRAWGSMELALAVEPKSIAEFATVNAIANELVPVCHERRAQKKAEVVGMLAPDQVVAGQ